MLRFQYSLLLVLFICGCRPSAADRDEAPLARLERPTRFGRVILVPDGWIGRLERGGSRLTLAMASSVTDDDPRPGDRPYEMHLDCNCASATDGDFSGGIVIGTSGPLQVPGLGDDGLWEGDRHAGESGGCDWYRDSSGSWNCKKDGNSCPQPVCSVQSHKPH